MTFLDSQFESGYVIYATKGGAGYKTIVVQVNGGQENRNSAWQYPLSKYNFGDRKLPDIELNEIINWFNAVQGMAIGFRLKDYGDYQITTSQGTFGPIGLGTGLPTYQCTKNYNVGGSVGQRLIYKLVSGTFAGFRNGTPLVVGSGAGNIGVNLNTGLVTFVADAQAAVTNITLGTTTQVILASNPHSLVAGGMLCLNGLTDAAGILNGKSWPITTVSGGTFTLAVNTTGATISVGSGIGYAYPQPSDVLTFSSQFDVPVRFDTDNLEYTFEGAEIITPGVTGTLFFYLASLPLVEIRDIS